MATKFWYSCPKCIEQKPGYKGELAGRLLHELTQLSQNKKRLCISCQAVMNFLFEFDFKLGVSPAARRATALAAFLPSKPMERRQRAKCDFLPILGHHGESGIWQNRLAALLSCFG